MKAIKKRLIDREKTMSELAGETRYTLNYVSQIVNGRMRHLPAQRRIARVLRMKMDRAFPRRGKGGRSAR